MAGVTVVSNSILPEVNSYVCFPRECHIIRHGGRNAIWKASPHTSGRLAFLPFLLRAAYVYTLLVVPLRHTRRLSP